MNDARILSEIERNEQEKLRHSAGKELVSLIRPETLIGDLLTINYSESQVLVHDYAKQQVRGLPHGSFLVASRVAPGDDLQFDADDEECCLVLLRIIQDAPLPNANEMEHFRFQAGMRSANSTETWDDPRRIDEWTKNNLGFGAYKCRVLGTFRMKKDQDDSYALSFGADLINFYTGLGMKVYKPTGRLLERIVNFQRPLGNDDGKNHQIRVGRVRFASSEIGVREDLDNVPVRIDPRDFIARRTFYGGMSRGGKSNAMKISARALYLLRADDEKFRVGQLIFDPNGEYANENVQDKGSLKNTYLGVPGAKYDDEVETYGLTAHPNDPNRKIVKINFYGQHVSSWSDAEKLVDPLDQLIVGKQIIDTELAEAQAQYVRKFRDTLMEIPSAFAEHGESVRFHRLVTVYRGILSAAGFEPPSTKVSIKSLFNKQLRTAMKGNSCQEPATQSKIASAGGLLDGDSLTWSDFVAACKGLRAFMSEKNSGYDQFETAYSQSKNGKRWSDDALEGLLAIYDYPNGVAQFKLASRQHSPKASSDYAADIVYALRRGKLVIFDQSTGDPEQNVRAAERILWQIFNAQKQDFIDPKRGKNGEIVKAPPIIVYLEEAHNLLPAAGGKDELRSIWARTAKEGSKYQIGMVLATQEPSSVMPAILKNTDNWFVAHLNNADEVRTLSKFYDFEDYSHQIRTISDPGFVRMRTLSNPYTIPVQIDLFTAIQESP